MSSSTEETEEAAEIMCCASCGIAEVDEIKLKECDDCDLVQYCSDNCQKNHLPQHKKECKKRAAELRDELFFQQPESIASYLGLDESIEFLKECYAHGEIREEDLAAALRAYQAAVDAMKSPQREEAEIAELNSEQVVELSDEQKHRDEILFKQPESSHMGDCPICLLPLSLNHDGSAKQSCCGKLICRGCSQANKIREWKESLEQRCPFCRQKHPETQAEADTNNMKRAEANDPVAIRDMGVKCENKGDYVTAFEYFTKSAGLGDALAHHRLSMMYWKGHGVEKDEKKLWYHLEEAAIGGHPAARFNLGIRERTHGRIERALKHWIIAANLGFDNAIDTLKIAYKEGDASKADLAAALRAHQAAVGATKSSQREAAAKAGISAIR